MEWSRNQVLRLVEMYHSQPALWDTSDPRFKDRQAKRWSLMTIASQMGLPPIDIEKKIHCLRTQFNREYLKMKTSARRPTWFAYQPLTFVLRNKQDVPDDILQWKPGTITVKEEFLDEYDADDMEMRLAIDETPVNFVMKDDDNNTTDNIIIEDNSNNITNTGNHSINNTSNTSNNNNIKDNQDNVSSDTEIETSSAVEVILRETNDEPHTQHQNKRFCRSNQNIMNNEFLSCMQNYLKTQNYSNQSQPQSHQQRYNSNNNANNNNNNSSSGSSSTNNNNNNNNSNLFTNNDELAMFGRLLTDELLKVNDFYTLQLAKYEISKIIFKATTGAYDNTNTEDHYTAENSKWKTNKVANDVDKRVAVSSLNELKTFSVVVINELRTITNNYSLQVAKFHINQVIFHATTAGIAPTPPLQSTDLSNDNSSTSSSSNNVISGN